MAVLKHQGWRDGRERWVAVGKRTCVVVVDEQGGAMRITGEGAGRRYYYYGSEWAGLQAALEWADRPARPARF